MSFPTKFSTSPAYQRDYALLGNRPFQSSLEPDLVSEGGEQDEDAADAGNGDDDQDASEVGTEADDSMRSDADSMSAMSLPGQSDTLEQSQQQQRQRTGRRKREGSASKDQESATGEPRARSASSRQPSAHPASPHMGPLPSSSGLGGSGNEYIRGGRSGTFHQGLAMTTANARRPSMARSDAYGGMSQVGGIPSSYILGGHHMMPPADADMRSQTELDHMNSALEEDEASQAEGSDEENDSTHMRPADNDVTPRPGMYTTQPELRLPAGPRRPSTSSYAGTGVEASERSPLLSSNHGASAYGSASLASLTPTHYKSHHPQQTPVQAASSGWDLQQPGPPTHAQVDEIAHEPHNKLHRRELRVLSQFAGQVWACHLLELSLNIVSVFSLGHLGTNELAAASLSSMTANVTGFSILHGFISALDSILPGAYTSQPKMVGLYAQRMMVVVAYLLVPICLVWLSAENILLFLGQDPIVANLAAQYLRILSIGIPAYAGFEVCRRYLQAQGLMHAPTIVLIFVSPLNAFLNWLLVWGPDRVRLGFIGAPIASVIAMWIMCILGLLQCVVAPRVAWDGWSRLAFTGLKPLWQLGTAGTLAMCAEWWSWEIVGLVTSKLGTVALAAQSVLLVCSSISYQLPYGLSAAAAVRVGNLLGAALPREANVASDMAMLLSVVAGAFNSGLFLLARSNIGWLFSNDDEVVALVTSIIPLMALFQVADGVCGVASGILRGTGRQAAGAIINLTGYYVVGIPIGLALTFSRLQWGLSGLWLGLTTALMYGSVFSFLIIHRTDWEAEVHKTQARMGADETVKHDQRSGGDSSAATGAAAANAASSSPAIVPGSRV